MEEKKKFKIITISDHPLVSSGVGTQTKYIIEGLLATGRYQFRSVGGAMKHADYRPQKLSQYQDDWIIYPFDGYGSEDLLREMLDAEKPDAVWFMTDPRFFGWLANMSDEVRDRGIPLLYYHVWDNYPVPDFNKRFYESCDFIGCISKLTHDIVCKLGMKDNSEYIPHAVNRDVFIPFDAPTINKLKEEILGKNKDKFIIFYNSRNARRKMTSDVVKTFKMFLDKVGKKAYLLMHTDPHDKEGANLEAVAGMLGLDNNDIGFSKERVPPEKMSAMYNISDVTINISNNEGFGLSCLESLSCGIPVIINRTGGLQDQATDDEGNELGVVIEPATKTLTGSQEIPYIFDDRCSDEDIVKAFVKMFNMTDIERKNISTKARKWTEKRFKLEDMVNLWDVAFMKYIKKFKQVGGYQNRLRFKKL